MVVPGSNLTSISQFPAIANDNSSGLFWPSMLHMVFVVLIIGLSNWGLETAILLSSFLCLIMAFLMTYAGYVSWEICVEFVAILLFTIIFKYANSSR